MVQINACVNSVYVLYQQTDVSESVPVVLAAQDFQQILQVVTAECLVVSR